MPNSVWDKLGSWYKSGGKIISCSSCKDFSELDLFSIHGSEFSYSYRYLLYRYNFFIITWIFTVFLDLYQNENRNILTQTKFHKISPIFISQYLTLQKRLCLTDLGHRFPPARGPGTHLIKFRTDKKQKSCTDAKVSVRLYNGSYIKCKKHQVFNLVASRTCVSTVHGSKDLTDVTPTTLCIKMFHESVKGPHFNGNDIPRISSDSPFRRIVILHINNATCIGKPNIFPIDAPATH